MSRKAWFLWRSGSRAPSPIVVFDELPGRDGRAYGAPILATHELPPSVAAEVEAGTKTNADLARIYPPPADAEGAKP